MHFHQNNTFPKTNETSDNAHHNTCTDYPPITAQCIYRVATIPTSFQPQVVCSMWWYISVEVRSVEVRSICQHSFGL